MLHDIHAHCHSHTYPSAPLHTHRHTHTHSSNKAKWVKSISPHHCFRPFAVLLLGLLLELMLFTYIEYDMNKDRYIIVVLSGSRVNLIKCSQFMITLPFHHSTQPYPYFGPCLICWAAGYTLTIQLWLLLEVP
jgi:hypothetical protein